MRNALRHESAKWARDVVVTCVLIPAGISLVQSVTPAMWVVISVATLIPLVMLENWPWLHRRGLNARPAVVIGIGIILIAAGALWGLATRKPMQEDSPNFHEAKEAPEPARLHTLEELYETDFAGLNIARNETRMTLGEPPPLRQIHAAYIIDLNIGASFVSFYVPADIDTREAGDYVLAHAEEFVEDREKNTKLTGKVVGDSQPIHIPKFGRRVYIYHDGPISAEDVGALTKQFSERKLDVIFRSSDYAAGRYATDVLIQQKAEEQKNK